MTIYVTEKLQKLDHSLTHLFVMSLLQVDLLKSTSLPLMKKFGIDGEGFELKVKLILTKMSNCVTTVFKFDVTMYLSTFSMTLSSFFFATHLILL